MGATTPKEGALPEGLTERQKKWFGSVQASLERDTGKTLAEWVAIARTCPHDKPKARTDWLREHHGLGVNRAAHVLSVAFPPEHGWDDAEALRKLLWTDPASLAILEAIEAAVATLPGHVTGQRKGFTAWSRKVQFAALRPIKGGTAVLGLALTPQANPRLLEPKNEGWSERLKAKLPIAVPADVDAAVEDLLKAAWERS
jgi:hypothetical protein